MELELEYLQECYNAVLLRRVERGRQSIRTRHGYELLRAKYQPRLRFLHDAEALNVDTSEEATLQDGHHNDDERLDGNGELASFTGVRDSRSDGASVTSDKDFDDDDDDDADDDREVLEKVVGVYFNARIKRFLSEVCWPLAHFGGEETVRAAPYKQVREREAY